MSVQTPLQMASLAFAQGWPESEASVARERFEAVAPRLDDCLAALYGTHEGFDAWRIGLYRSIGALAGRRTTELKALDRQRAAQPDWFIRRKLVGYTAYVDRFGGTLKGMRERISYLSSLGVGYLHLLPFLRARAGDSDGGFAVSRFDEVEPSLGDMHDLAALAGDLRKAGISLCADFVLNHVADDHPWVQAARKGDPAYMRRFHILDSQEDVDAYEQALGQVFPQTAPGNFTYEPALRAWVWTTFYPYQWDLNYAQPVVFQAMTEAMLGLANHGVEVFRLDSVPYLWKRRGTACVNEPEVHQLVGALRAVADLCAPACLLKAEAITSTEKLLPYFGRGALQGHECQLAYQSSLMAASWVALAEESAGVLRDVLAVTLDLPPATGWLTYVRCHDDIVWGVLREDLQRTGMDYEARIARAARRIEGRDATSFGRGAPFQYAHDEHVHGSIGMTASLLGLPADPRADPDAASMARLALMYGLAFWVGAVPMIYMGDELGQGNNADPGDAVRIEADGRWMQRPRLDEERIHLAAQGIGVPAAVRALFNRLCRARAQLSLLGMCAPCVVAESEPALLTLKRGEHELAMFNFSSRDVAVTMAGPGWSTLYPGMRDDGVLPAWGMHWGVRS